MRVRLVTLRYAPSLGGFDDRPLVELVRDKEVLAVREHFFAVNDLPHLACLVTYQDPVVAATSTAGAASTPRAARIDRPASSDFDRALADLTPENRVLFGTLREWRTVCARREGVPPYVVFTNRELLALVRAKPKTPSAMQSIDGIGPSKVERHGPAVLAQLHGAGPAAPLATAPTIEATS